MQFILEVWSILNFAQKRCASAGADGFERELWVASWGSLSSALLVPGACNSIYSQPPHGPSPRCTLRKSAAVTCSCPRATLAFCRLPSENRSEQCSPVSCPQPATRSFSALSYGIRLSGHRGRRCTEGRQEVRFLPPGSIHSSESLPHPSGPTESSCGLRGGSTGPKASAGSHLLAQSLGCYGCRREGKHANGETQSSLSSSVSQATPMS